MHRHQNCAFILNIDTVMAVFTYLLLQPQAISAAILAAIRDFLMTEYYPLWNHNVTKIEQEPGWKI